MKDLVLTMVAECEWGWGRGQQVAHFDYKGLVAVLVLEQRPVSKIVVVAILTVHLVHLNKLRQSPVVKGINKKAVVDEFIMEL